MASPKLRFKEFDQKWGVSSLQEQIDFLAGYAFDSKLMSNEPKKYQLIKMSNVYQNQLDLTRNPSYWTNIDSKIDKFLLKKGDIVLTLTGTVGKTDYGYNVEIDKDDKFLLNQRLVRLRAKQDLSDSKFIQYRISTDKFFYHFFNSSKGGTGNQSNVSIEDLKLLELNFPSKEEQTKIASFLSAVDEKIRQLIQKHELLSQYKQGMMQKLFSQQIHFKADDGSEFGEWATEKITKVFTNKSKSFNPLLNESLPCIELEHLSQNTGQILGTVNSRDQQSTKNLFEPNSVLYGKLRPYLRKFAKPQFKGVCSSEIWVLTGLKISNNYLFQFVQSEQFTELTNIQSGSKMPRADWNVIADAEIEYPCLEEQTKIANFLSAIDQKIEVVAQQIEQAKQWKKGLLQQMFV